MINIFHSLLLMLGETSTNETLGALATIGPWLIAAIGTVIGIVGQFSNRQKSIHETDVKRGDALEKLLKVREEELEKTLAQLKEVKEDFDDLTVEYRTQAGIKIKELALHWESKETLEAQWQLDKATITRLQRALKLSQEKEG